MLVLCLLPTALSAQSVRWDPPGGQLGYNQTSGISLTFDDCEPDLDNLKLPAVDGLVFGQPSQSSSTSIVNFKMSRQFSLVFPVRPTKHATIQIPAFDVPTDKGAMHVAAARYAVGEATVGSTGLAVNDVSTSKIDLPRDSFWAGEVIPVTYTLSVVRRYFHQLVRTVDWQSAPMVIESWSKPEASETMVGGDRRVVVTQKTRGYVKQPGTYTLKPASLLAVLQVGTSGFGLFTTPTLEQLVLSTDPVPLTVRPLPPAPAGFSGAVGQFTLVSKIVPTSPAVGDPVTWTLELSGTGNWPDIPALPSRDVSSDFQVVQPKSKRTMKDDSPFEGTLSEDVVLVPSKPGTYTLGAVRFTYFDTGTGTYKTIGSDPVTLTVSPAAAPTAGSTTGAPLQFSLGPQPSARPATPVAPSAVPPVPPENLPRDPLAGAAHGLTPVNPLPLVVRCLVAAVALPLLCWVALALVRSRMLDPERRRRAARNALAGLLVEIRTATASGFKPSPSSFQLLRQWQQHAADLWRIRHAAPGAPLVQARVAPQSESAAAAWSGLWADADRALHGRLGGLPDDWPARAEAALQAVKVPRWKPSSALTARHLFPNNSLETQPPAAGPRPVFRVGAWLLVVLSLAALAPSMRGADAPLEAYRHGEFATAETGWTQALATRPADWTLRHNLGLALAQQDRWAEATAQWASAFLLYPRADATRWDLSLGLQRSGLAPAELVDFAHGTGRRALARAASPGEWQAALVAASLLIALALITLLFRAYGRVGPWARPTAMGTILVAILLASAATFSLRTYGQLADPAVAMVWRASILRSIPTEADTTQKSSALSAGSIAVVDRTFLGWSRLAFAGGQSGWVRSEDIVMLYR